jgi:hypothetical protein
MIDSVLACKTGWWGYSPDWGWIVLPESPWREKRTSFLCLRSQTWTEILIHEDVAGLPRLTPAPSYINSLEGPARTAAENALLAQDRSLERLREQRQQREKVSQEEQRQRRQSWEEDLAFLALVEELKGCYLKAKTPRWKDGEITRCIQIVEEIRSRFPRQVDLIENHDKSLDHPRIPTTRVLMGILQNLARRPRPARSGLDYCWKNGKQLSSQTHQTCADCGWFICDDTACASGLEPCGCGYVLRLVDRMKSHFPDAIRATARLREPALPGEPETESIPF